MEVRDVVVSGVSVACATGPDVGSFRAHLASGAPTTRSLPPGRAVGGNASTVVAATMVGDVPGSDVVRDPGYLLDLAMRQAVHALRGSRPVAPQRVGVVLATTVGAFFRSLAYQRSVVAGVPDPDALRGPVTPAMLAGAIADRLRVNGPAVAVLTACAAGTDAIGQGWQLVRSGACDRVVVLGVDFFSPLSVAGFTALRALSRSGQARPYDVARDGLTLGDGAAAMVLEVRHPSTEPLARVLGYASGNEARHPTSPDPDGKTLVRVMGQAIPRGVPLERLGYVNGHGTGTAANDQAEVRALGRLLHGERAVPVSSTKHLTGHTLGAAGVVEAIACVLAIRDGLVPGNHRTCDPVESDPSVRLPRDSEQARVRVAMSVNLAFSGNVSAVVLGAP